MGTVALRALYLQTFTEITIMSSFQKQVLFTLYSMLVVFGGIAGSLWVANQPSSASEVQVPKETVVANFEQSAEYRKMAREIRYLNDLIQSQKECINDVRDGSEFPCTEPDKDFYVD
jgi:hypothetical protein